MFGGKKEKGEVDYHEVIIKGTGLHLIQFSLQCTEETFPVLSGHLRVTSSSWEKYLLSEKVLTFDSNERGGDTCLASQMKLTHSGNHQG